MKRIDYEQVAGEALMVQMEIAVARDNGDFDDVLNVCQSLLDLIEKINERESGR